MIAPVLHAHSAKPYLDTFSRICSRLTFQLVAIKELTSREIRPVSCIIIMFRPPTGI